MKLSDGVETALHCTASLAGLPEGAVLPAAAMAAGFEVSPSYLVKHLKALVADGILISEPGPTGGYRLGRAASEITFLDIVLAVEGPQHAFRCKEIRRNGPCRLGDDAFPAPCGIKLAMWKAEAAYRAALADVTIASIVEDFVETSDPRVVQRSADYVAEHTRRKP